MWDIKLRFRDTDRYEYGGYQREEDEEDCRE